MNYKTEIFDTVNDSIHDGIANGFSASYLFVGSKTSRISVVKNALSSTIHSVMIISLKGEAIYIIYLSNAYRLYFNESAVFISKFCSYAAMFFYYSHNHKQKP